MMELNELGLTERQCSSLNKRKITSVEAMLRKQPNHYWDFTNTYALDIQDEQTCAILQRRAPFAIIGTCLSCQTEQRDHTMMLKLRVEDEQTKQKDGTRQVLQANILGLDAFKYRLLEDLDDNPMTRKLIIPDALMFYENAADMQVSAKCAKAIAALNQEEPPAAQALGSLRVFGKDACSSMGEAALREACGPEVWEAIGSAFCGADMRELQKRCAKWYLRGLRLDLAIRRILLECLTVSSMLVGKRVIVGGFITYNEAYRTFSVLNPPVFSWNIERYHTFYVQHGQIKSFTAEDYRNALDLALQKISSFDIMPPDLLQKAGLPSFLQSARMMHHPQSWRDVQTAKKRAVFDDLMYLAVKLQLNHAGSDSEHGAVCNDLTLQQAYLASLPYALTNGQKQAIDTVSAQMAGGRRVNCLIQGDVGTGKTCVAFALLLQAAGSGYQGALAVPYTTLAWQHYRDLSEIAKNAGLKIAFLTSETKAAEKRKMLAGIESGEISLIVGTHSIFAEPVQYHNLGLVVIDEEHKFGVVHRGNFMEKGVPGCHKITMSATPIPKSLADTVYGEDSGIITITDKPAERLPVKTAITQDDVKAARHMIGEIQKGHQAYIVCPAIDKNDKAAQAYSIEEKERIYRSYFNQEHITMSVLTGKMKAAEKTELMQKFAEGQIDVLMATTVIEVGMNVPNATVITITGADRFGFSTLHQLRGRVGRGRDQAYCILQTEAPNEKLEFLRSTTDGFLIAEKDLELRGPGTLFGDRQTGNNYFIDLMLAYPNMFQWIKKEAKHLCETQTGKDIVRRYEELFLSEEKR